jgi:hypothetical protein
MTTPPLSLDEALAAYATAVADLIHASREAEKTAAAVREARKIDDVADKAREAACQRLSTAAEAVRRAQERALDSHQPDPPHVAPVAEIDEEDVHAYEYAWLNGAIP